MKFILLLFSYFLFAFATVNAQDEMPVEVINRETSMGSQSGFMITIKNANLKTVTKEWEKEIKNSKFSDILKKSETKVQFIHQNDEYIANNAIIKTISSEPLTVITTISDIHGGIRFIAFIKYDSIFISKESSKEETCLAAKNYIRGFGIKSLKNVVKKELNQEKDKLKNLEKGMENLISDKDDFEKEINSDSSDIRDLKNQIKANLIDQEKQLSKVEIAKDTLYTFNKKSDEYKIFKNKLKDEQRSLKKLVKNNKSYHMKIKKNELDIEKAYNNIQNNVQEQGHQKDLIHKQKRLVSDIEKHLRNIK